jgi:NitT/TauT family transport system substrate-binding protein
MRMTGYKRWLSVRWFLTVAVVALIAAACGTATSSGPTQTAPLPVVNVAYMAGLTSLPVGIVEHTFQKAGIRVNPVLFTTGPAEVAAMASGSVDIAFIGPGALFLAVQHKAEVIGVNDVSSTCCILSDQPGVTTAAEMKGHTVLTPAGTSGEMILYLALHQAGLSLKDVNMVDTAPQQIVTAMVAHKASIASIWTTYQASIRAHVPGISVIPTNFYPKVALTDLWVASPSFVKSHPTLVVKFLQGIMNAQGYFLAHKTSSSKLVANSAHIPLSTITANEASTVYVTPKQMVSDAANGTVTHWLNVQEAMFHAMGVLKSTPPVSTFYNSKLMVSAGAAAGVKP